MGWWSCLSMAASCSALMPVLGQCGGVSWQGHLSGAVAGVVAAYLLSAPERKARALKRAGARSGHPKL
ncbi:hypothetical protein ACNJIS_16170 [Mycobacterium tuberculosis]